MRHSLLALIPALVLAACDSASPSPSDTPHFNAFLDNQSWVADTALAIAFASPTDTAITITAVRRVSLTESQEITVFLKSWAKGASTLGDTAAAGIGAFSITQIDGDSAVGFLIYRTSPTSPGHASILGLTRSDSLIEGTLQIEAATTPESLPHRFVTATFRLRYSLQQVFTPENPDAT